MPRVKQLPAILAASAVGLITIFFCMGSAASCFRGQYRDEMLIQAAGEGRLEDVRMFLRAGASPNKQDDFGSGPLYYAAYNDHPAVVRELIRAGANVNAVNPEGETALDAAHTKETWSLLKEHGAKRGRDLK